MCGICGEWNTAGATAEVLERMSRLLRHRGPDDEGQVVAGEAGLAMRRLSIIDLEHGRQPISNEDDTAWIVFNGEIYNHEELRKELIGRGHRFKTAADTEVILHLYEEQGERAVDALRGMFAFAIWDAKRRRLLLARDRFGQKPLYYSRAPGRLVFGSEVKAVVAGSGGAPRLDLESLDDYLSLRFVPSPATMLRDVRKLPPGHLLVLDAAGDSVEVRRYWDLTYLPKRRLDEKEATEELRTRLLDAVESHLVSDVPVGAYLSGGLDSSLIVAMMASLSDQPVQTFAIGVKEQDFDELPFARLVAERYGTDHFEEIVFPDLVRLLPRIVHHLDEPSDPVAACMHQGAALAARHVKVVMCGDGGDEVFAGFDRYYGFSWVKLYAMLPAPVRRLLLGPLFRLLPDSAGYKNLTQKIRWMHDLSFHRGGRRYAEATVFFRFGDEGKGGLYTPELMESLDGHDSIRCIVDGFDAAAASDDLDRMLYCDSVTRMTEHSLMLTDRLTMAHGLEGRCPYLDHRLAEFVATLPVDLKMRGRTLKYLMRKLAAEYLPDTIVRRPKQGFMFPLGYWMKGPLLPVLRHVLQRSRLVEAGIFRGEAIARLLDEHVAGRSDHHVRLWMLLNLEIWYRMVLGGESQGPLGEMLAGSVSA